MLRIHVVDDVVYDGRLTPAHVPPVRAKHGGKVGIASGASAAARAGENGTAGPVGVRPSVAAVGGPVEVVGSVAKAATSFVHRGNVNIAGDDIACNLNVPEKAGVNRYRGVPGEPVITGVGGEQRASPHIEVVPRNIHSVVERRGWVHVRPAGLTVVLGVTVNAAMRPASGVRWSRGLIVTQALTAAGSVEPDREPGAARSIVQADGVTKGAGEWALTAGIGKSGESRAAIRGDRCAGKVAAGRAS
jgi:hypothetical protein